MEKSRLLFTPETPLGQDVQSLLMQHPEGLRLDEIRRLLRREKGLHVTWENLRALLACSQAIVKDLEQVWGCEVFNHYGATEMGLGGGVECAAHRGYHMRVADLYFEVVDPLRNTD